ncbi:hypothetical protein evm_012105 [Chilo suppressalis]|nr:hypothetical protein evm_012105 [Chilo suppressalis]
MKVCEKLPDKSLYGGEKAKKFYPLCHQFQNAFYEKIYGKCLANESGNELSSNLLVECPEILLAREKQEAKKEVVREETTPKSDKSLNLSHSSISKVSPALSVVRPVDRQIETRTSDGKRRITPVFIPLTSIDANESMGSQPSGGENCFSTSSQSKSRIRVEVRDDIIIHPNVSNHAALNNSRLSDNGLDQRLRKRSAGGGGSGAGLPGPRVGGGGASESGAGAKRARPTPAPGPAACLAAPALGTAGPVVRAAGPLRLQRARPAPAPGPAACLAAPALGTAGPVVRAAGPLRLQVRSVCASSGPSPRPPACLAAPALGTAGPVVRAAGPLRLQVRSVCASSGPAPRPRPARPAPACLAAPALGTAGPVVRAAGPLRLQVVNKAVSTYYGTLARLQLLPNNSVSNDPVWETYLGSAVTCVSCDARWACAGCADGVLHVWRLTRGNATRALPPVALMSPAVKMTLSGDTLAVVTTAAELAIWDLANATCLIRPLCFRGLLAPNVTVTNCSLLEDGHPMISLSNGKSYIYSKKLSSWVVWSDCTDPVWRACGSYACTRTPPAALALHPRYPSTREQRRPQATQASTQYSATAARSWLEAQVAVCLHLRLPRDYRHWKAALFQHLVQHGSEDQLRALLDDMLGPSHAISTPRHWENSILGIKKHDILEEMLSLLVRQLRWQRLYTEYAEQLQALAPATANVSATANVPANAHMPALNGH